MEITDKEMNGCLILSFSGEIRLDMTDEVKAKFNETLGRNPTRVIIDLAKTTYSDSSGIATFIKFKKDLENIDAELYLVGLNQDLKNLFQITNLDSLFNIHKNREEVFDL